MTCKCVQVRMCCQLDNAVDVEVLPPYVPSEEEKASPTLYAKNVQRLYAKTLNLPTVNQVSPIFVIVMFLSVIILIHERLCLLKSKLSTAELEQGCSS